MNTAQPPDDDAITAARKLDSAYADNKNYSRGQFTKLGNGNVCSVQFQDAADRWYTRYVYERAGRYRAYYTFESVVMDPANGILAAWKDLEWLRFAVVSLLALFLTIIVFYLATHPETTVGLQTIVTLLGTALGWLVGTKGSGTKTRT